MDLDALHAGHRRVSCSAPVKPPRYRPCGGRETGARRFSALDRRVRCVTRTGRTLRLSRRSPVGRQRQFVTIRCGRSVPKLRRSSVCTRERPLPPSPTSSTAGTKVKFQGRPVARRENCRRLRGRRRRARPGAGCAPLARIDGGGAGQRRRPPDQAGRRLPPGPGDCRRRRRLAARRHACHPGRSRRRLRTSANSYQALTQDADERCVTPGTRLGMPVPLAEAQRL